MQDLRKHAFKEYDEIYKIEEEIIINDINIQK